MLAHAQEALDPHVRPGRSPTRPLGGARALTMLLLLLLLLAITSAHTLSTVWPAKGSREGQWCSESLRSDLVEMRFQHVSLLGG